MMILLCELYLIINVSPMKCNWISFVVSLGMSLFVCWMTIAG